jgi:hypothetical protein
MSIWRRFIREEIVRPEQLVFSDARLERRAAIAQQPSHHKRPQVHHDHPQVVAGAAQDGIASPRSPLSQFLPSRASRFMWPVMGSITCRRCDVSIANAIVAT